MASINSTTLSDDAALAARLTEVLRAFPEIKAAYLFGSCANGKARGDSDIDVAVVTRRRMDGVKLDILGALANAGLERVDLVALDDNDIVMRHEAVRPNRLLYASADFDPSAYFSRTIREHEDFEPYLARQRRAYRRRLERGSS